MVGNRRYFYFDVRHAIHVHDWIIENSGGMPGISNRGNLESSLEHIKNNVYYPEIEDKLTHLVFSINKNHAFVDGNKRASIALGAYFLELNGYDFIVAQFVIEMENVAVLVADNKISKKLLYKIIYSLLNEDDYSEELKIELLEAIDIGI